MVYREDLAKVNAVSLEFDTVRTLLLYPMMRHWGIPESRRILTNDRGSRVEVIRIPSKKKNHIVRYVTIGLCRSVRRNGDIGAHELLFVTIEKEDDLDLRKATFEWLLSISSYYIETNIIKELPDFIKPSSISPWRPNAVLFDEPRGEPEELENFILGKRVVSLVWVIPIYEAENKLILEDGIDKFDRLCDKQRIDLINPRRCSVI